MAALLSREHALYVEMRQRYQSNCCGKDRSTTPLLFCATYFQERKNSTSFCRF